MAGVCHTKNIVAIHRHIERYAEVVDVGQCFVVVIREIICVPTHLVPRGAFIRIRVYDVPCMENPVGKCVEVLIQYTDFSAVVQGVFVQLNRNSAYDVFSRHVFQIILLGKSICIALGYGIVDTVGSYDITLHLRQGAVAELSFQVGVVLQFGVIVGIGGSVVMILVLLIELAPTPFKLKAERVVGKKAIHDIICVEHIHVIVHVFGWLGIELVLRPCRPPAEAQNNRQ